MSSPLESALAHVDAAEDRAQAWLRTWVDINSFSGNPTGCDAVAASMRTAFAWPGLVGETLSAAAGSGVGDHQVWSTASFARGRGTLLIGHHDTVFPDGTFAGYTVEGDRARGPGVLDMKGGWAVMWLALEGLAQAGVLASLPLALISVADEEIGSPDSAPQVQAWAQRAREALVFEAGRAGDAIVTARKGTGKLRCVMHGKAAHAGNDLTAGVNAIGALARWIDQAQAATDLDRGVTVNVGLVRGGTSANTVPAHAEAEADLRFVRQADGLALVQRLTEAGHAIAQALGARAEFDGGIRRPALEPTDASRALCARYATAARAEGLGGEEAARMGGGSDANTVAAVGCPVIDGLGPRGRGFHTHDEWIELASLRTKARALVRHLLATHLS